jgi:transposase
MAINSEQFGEILRLRMIEGWSIRRIARRLRISRDVISRKLTGRSVEKVRRRRSSKLDSFKPMIAGFLEIDPKASGTVILQRIQVQGYTGGKSILQQWLQKERTSAKSKRAYVRVEVLPGERFEVDWGHFGSLDYGAKRKLYAFCLVDAHSRRLYLEFTHSQSFETFARCHQHAFRYMGGVARQIAYDNLTTAVIEHTGNLVRFNHRFLGFARDYSFCPRACHVASPWEKGKVERSIRYVKENFWPLRSFTDLADVNAQARQWLNEVANQRLHRETNEKPEEKFKPDALRPLPPLDGDYRDCRLAPVHKDLRMIFDGNRYCVAAKYVGRRLIIRADSHSVSIYDGVKEVVCYARCYGKGNTLGAERFEKELLQQRPAARASARQQRLILLVGTHIEPYLTNLASTNRPVSGQITELLELVRVYGPDEVSAAIDKAGQSKAYGSSYVSNILQQQHCPRNVEPPVRLKQPSLNDIELDPVSLLEYDDLIFRNGRQ